MSIAHPTDRTPLRVVSDAVCTFCGCMCDDIELKIAGNQVIQAGNACTLGATGFLQRKPEIRTPAMIGGKAVSLAEAFDKAATILADARFPLIYGLSESTSEAQRMAVALADRVGACIDLQSAQDYRRFGMAFQNVGKVTCSLGEVKNRADLIVFWGANPAESHPRHADRYSTKARGLFTPKGREDRHVVVVDVRHTPTAAQANQFLRVLPGKDFEVLWCLRALVKGVAVPDNLDNQTGISVEQLRDLANRMRSCSFGVIFFGPGLSKTAGGQMNVEAAISLVQELNQSTRFYALPLGEQGNACGAENVVTWQTGYPCAVQMGRGYPRYNPGEFSASSVLERGEADAAMIISADPAEDFPQAAINHLAGIPNIILTSSNTAAMNTATVAFSVAIHGIESAGTVYRTDDVPLTLRPAFDSPCLSEAAVLRGIDHAVRALGLRP